MFIKHPISSGIALMLTCFIAFMTQASIDYEDEYVQYHAFSQVQEVKKDKKPKVCAKKLEKQQQEIADKLKDIKKKLRELKK